jgi:hypothetical protein
VKSNLATTISAAILGTLACVICLFSLYLTWTLRWDGPFRDLWEFVPDIEKQFRGEWSWHYLLDPYGGAHRLLLPKLLFFADNYWWGGRNLLTTFVALLCQAIYAALLWRFLANEKSLSAEERGIIAASFLIALFSTSQISNFLYAMDVQWHMSNVLGLASLCALISGSRLSHVILFLLLAAAAALCNFTGLMALPVGAAILFCRDRKNHSTRVWLTVSLIAVLCLLYGQHEKNTQHIVVQVLKQSEDWRVSVYVIGDTLQKMLIYMLRYLASPLSRQWPITGNAVSLASCGIALLYAVRYLRRPHCLSTWQQLCLAICGYILLSATATAFGRLIYPNSAINERYQTLVLPFLPAVAGLLWPDLSQRWRNTATVAWLGLFGLFLLLAQMASAHNMAQLSRSVNLSHTAARAAVLEFPYINATLSYPLLKNKINSVKDNDNFLRSEKLGYFQTLQQYLLDSHIPNDQTLPACTGSASITRDNDTGTVVIDGNLRFNHQTVVDIVVLQPLPQNSAANTDWTIVGFGLLLRPENNLLPLSWQPADESRFRAFVRTDRLRADTPLSLLGIRDSAAACLLTLP